MAAYGARWGPPLQPQAPPPQHWAAQPGPSHAPFAQQQPQQQPAHDRGLMRSAPPPPPPPPPDDSRLRSVDELPPCFRGVFPFRFFNLIQEACFPAVFQGGGNVVIAAPTGGGERSAGWE